MRVFPVFGAAVAASLIVGCGPRQDEPEANLAAAAPTAAAPAPTENGSAEAAPPKAAGGFEPVRGTTIPAPFVGVYDRTLASCAGPSQERTTITPGELRFHETIGKVQSTLLRRENELEVDAKYQGEGEFWRSNRLLTLSEGGARLVIDRDGNSPAIMRVRCPAGTS
ncbi:MAG TPA: hypothetical protein VFP12_15020 [Allosphingosinicella sp.]|nr:hypothetical protein [Allosphingosinicella sp.]